MSAVSVEVRYGKWVSDDEFVFAPSSALRAVVADVNRQRRALLQEHRRPHHIEIERDLAERLRMAAEFAWMDEDAPVLRHPATLEGGLMFGLPIRLRDEPGVRVVPSEA